MGQRVFLNLIKIARVLVWELIRDEMSDHQEPDTVPPPVEPEINQEEREAVSEQLESESKTVGDVHHFLCPIFTWE